MGDLNSGEDNLNSGEYYDNVDTFSQPHPENMPIMSFDHPIQIDDLPTNENDNTQPDEVETECMVKKRKQKSKVWDHFKIQEVDIGGLKCERAVYVYCKAPLSCKTTSATGHLNRHAKKCVEAHRKSDHSQSQLSRKDNGSVATFKYSQKEMRMGLATFIAAKELPFLFAQSPRFERFQRKYYQPEFKRIPLNTNKYDLLKVYKEEKQKLIHVFSNLKSSIAVTSDLWSGRNNLPFICVTAHYIDDNWMLHKRIIAFCHLEYLHTGRTIFNSMMDVFKEYNIVDKNFSVTFDNATNNTVAIDQLKRCLHPPYGGAFFHMRCACHIINIMVQDGLKLIGEHIGCVRDAIGFLAHSDSRYQEFSRLCKAQGLKPRKFKKDMPVRWNSVYQMLDSCRDYTNVLSVYYNDKVDDNILTDDMWQLCFKFLDFLKVFYDATCNCSGVYYPTSPIVLNDLYAISVTFQKYRGENGFFQEVCETMEAKYKKYWEEVPYTFCFGAILDPRIKLTSLEVILNEIGMNLSITLPLNISTIQKNFNDAYLLYDKKYADANVQERSEAAHCPSLTGSNATSSQAVMGLLASKVNRVISSCNEFFKYLDTNFVEFMSEEEKGKFDILPWWKTHSRNFPVMSIMARDILTIPVSTVASESAFSVSGRVLDEKRTRLAPKTLEALMCVKDWDDAEYREQSFVDEDLACDEEESSISID